MKKLLYAAVPTILITNCLYSQEITDAQRKYLVTLVTKMQGTVEIVEDEHSPASVAVTFDKLNDLQLSQLKKSPALYSLTVNDASMISDRAMPYLATCTELVKLKLHAAKLTSNSMPQIAKLTKLRYLYLAESKISDLGVSHLKSLENLEEIDLTSTLITDKAGPFLAEFPALKTISVNTTAFGDRGVGALQTLKKLEKLNAINTRVTNDGAQALEKEVPTVRIRR
ncbi:MAG: hypothetical protein R3B84_05170 [Zavarzinella sp.]